MEAEHVRQRTRMRQRGLCYGQHHLLQGRRAVGRQRMGLRLSSGR
jgi:hypothetical protein